MNKETWALFSFDFQKWNEVVWNLDRQLILIPHNRVARYISLVEKKKEKWNVLASHIITTVSFSIFSYKTDSQRSAGVNRKKKLFIVQWLRLYASTLHSSFYDTRTSLKNRPIRKEKKKNREKFYSRVIILALRNV